MKIDKENDGVAFNDSAHAYWDINNPKKEYISVTTLIGEVSPSKRTKRELLSSTP